MNKDIESYNNKKQRHGYWEKYWGDRLWYKKFYVNGKEVGYEECLIHGNNISLIFTI